MAFRPLDNASGVKGSRQRVFYDEFERAMGAETTMAHAVRGVTKPGGTTLDRRPNTNPITSVQNRRPGVTMHARQK